MQRPELAKLIMETVPPVMKSLRSHMRKSGRDMLSVPQFRVLLQLSREPQSNSELAEWMGVSAATMSNMIELLVQRGLVSRKAAARDRRQVVLRPTQKGADLAKNVREGVQKLLATKLGQFSDSELQELELGMHVLRKVLL